MAGQANLQIGFRVRCVVARFIAAHDSGILGAVTVHDPVTGADPTRYEIIPGVTAPARAGYR